MKHVLTAQQMRDLDAAAGRDFGMPAAVLMENAGEALARTVLEWVSPQGQVVVLCGSGNNGGDGLVAARKLSSSGRKVQVQLCESTRIEGEPARNWIALKANTEVVVSLAVDATVPLKAGDVVVDCVFGTGLNRAPAGPYADAVRAILKWHQAGATVVSADVPSGLSSDTGQPFELCVRADVTVAFGQLKTAHVVEPGASLCGRTVVADIGIPPEALKALPKPSVYALEEHDVRQRLPVRESDSHKGSYGHVLVVAGSWGKTGAAALTGLAALRSGAGLVTVATRPEALVPVLGHAPELMGIELISDGPLSLGDANPILEAAEGKDAIVLGPGIPRGEETGKLLGTLLEEISVPCVLDADALNALAGHVDILAQAQGPLILTPHPGEMARLVGKTVPEVQAQRLALARGFATQHKVTLILKGARTLIAFDDGEVWVNPTGNAGMATGGTGDVLAGMCGAFMAQGIAPKEAALIATYVHGRAGDLAIRKTGKLGFIASDLLAALGDVWAGWQC